MAANISDRFWSWEDIIVLIDKAEIDAVHYKCKAILEMPNSN